MRHVGIQHRKEGMKDAFYDRQYVFTVHLLENSIPLSQENIHLSI
jgi:hypothetical protein